MKIIDEKGKIFGIINLFDLFVAIVIITVTFGLFKFIKAGPQNIAHVNANNQSISVLIKVQNVEGYMIPSIYVQQIFDDNNKTVVDITGIRKEPQTGDFYTLYVSANLYGQETVKGFLFFGEPLYLARQINLPLRNAKMSGFLIWYNDSAIIAPEREELILLQILVKDIPSYMLENFRQLTCNDSDLSLVKTEFYYKQLDYSDGLFTFQVTCRKWGGLHYYHNQAIMQNSGLSIECNNVVINGIVYSVGESQSLNPSLSNIDILFQTDPMDKDTLPELKKGSSGYNNNGQRIAEIKGVEVLPIIHNMVNCSGNKKCSFIEYEDKKQVVLQLNMTIWVEKKRGEFIYDNIRIGVNKAAKLEIGEVYLTGRPIAIQ